MLDQRFRPRQATGQSLMNSPPHWSRLAAGGPTVRPQRHQDQIQGGNVMLDMSLSRRRLLMGASATAAARLFGTSATQAKAPPLNTPAPLFYRFKLGTIEATVVSDGPLPIGPAARTFRGPTEQELGKMMSDQFLPADNVV